MLHMVVKAYEPYDVDVGSTGLRPGEKLDETPGTVNAALGTQKQVYFSLDSSI